MVRVLRVETLGHGADRLVLIWAVGQAGGIGGLGQRLALGAPVDRQLQLVPGVESQDLALRVAVVLPRPMAVSIGVVDDRPLPLGAFKAIRVELCLVLAHLRIVAAAFDLQDCNRVPPTSVAMRLIPASICWIRSDISAASSTGATVVASFCVGGKKTPKALLASVKLSTPPGCWANHCRPASSSRPLRSSK